MQSIAGGCMASAREWLRNKMKMWTQPKRKWAFWLLSTTCSRDPWRPSAEHGYQPFWQLLSSTIFPKCLKQKASTIHSLQKACSFAEELHLHLKPWRRELTEFLMPAFVVCHLFNTKGKRQNLLCIPLFFFPLYTVQNLQGRLNGRIFGRAKGLEIQWKRTQTCTHIWNLCFIKLI